MRNIITLVIALLSINIGISQNLAESKTTDASSGNSSLAVDGNLGTRWESAFSDPQWWSVDLGATYTIDNVIIKWEGSYATEYKIQISFDNVNWTDIYSTTTGDGNTDDISLTGTGRYVRYYGTARALPYGHSFWEFEVYEAAPIDQDASLSDLRINGETVTNFSSSNLTYNVSLEPGTTAVPIVFGTTSQSSPANIVVTNAPSLPGTTTVLVTAQDLTTQETYTINFTVKKQNFAAGKTATASSEIQAASNAFDNNTNTRWESAQTDNEWIYVDLGTPFSVNGVTLNWEGAFGEDYTIDVSNDASSWSTVHTEIEGNGGIDEISFATTSARYVRMNGTKRGSPYGYSIFEFQVHADVTCTWDGSDSSDWNDLANWDKGILPTLSTNVIIPSGTAFSPTISSATGARVKDITINGGAILTVEHGGSILVSGTSSGEISYKINMPDTDWHLVASPVIGEQYGDTWNASNNIESGTGNNRAVGTYSNTPDSNGTWSYFTLGSPDATFNEAKGYAIKTTSAGNLTFTGTILTSESQFAMTINDESGPNENKWNLIGGSFPSYVNITSLLDSNMSNIDDSREAVYVWNGSTYSPITTGYLMPGQAFFVSANTAANFIFNKALLSHQTGQTFYKNSFNGVRVLLTVSNNSDTNSTEINYIDGKTKGLDPRFDLGTFTAESKGLSIYSHLVSDSKGDNFMRQALPKDFENLIVPIGIKANSGEEITITAQNSNLPDGIYTYLEDRLQNTYTNLNLNDPNSKYTFTTEKAIDGVGRFYLHTSSKVLNVGDNTIENNTKIYKIDANKIRISGISGEQSFKLYNIVGKQIIDSKFNSNGIYDVITPNLKAGVYIVKLTNNRGTVNMKIILE